MSLIPPYLRGGRRDFQSCKHPRGRNASDGRVLTFVIIAPKPFVARSPVESLDVRVLCREAGLRVQKPYPLSSAHRCISSPTYSGQLSQRIAFGRPRQDLFKTLDHTCRRQRKIDIHAEALAVVVVDHVECAKFAPAFKTVAHEVHGPHPIRSRRQQASRAFLCEYACGSMRSRSHS